MSERKPSAPVTQPVAIDENRLYSIIRSYCEPILSTRENGEWPRLVLYSCRIGYALCRIGRDRVCQPMFTEGIIDALGAYVQTLANYAMTLRSISQSLEQILSPRNRITHELSRAALYYEKEYEYAKSVLDAIRAGDIEAAMRMLRKMEGGSRLARLLEALKARVS